MTLEKLKVIFEEVLDIDPGTVGEETYVIRDLNAESIDLLELAVHVNEKFRINADDQAMFLRQLRSHTGEARIRGRYPHLREGREKEIMLDLEGGPVLKVSDLVDYIDHSLAAGR
ncbi:MAG: hypothetical protein HY550_03120 [Elusimicrobia bacterium]|nr:hypothetical protein [Elusimicrobiota bacterium]